jgi:hypothetical protein
MQRIASGQDFGQSGNAGVWWGQQGIPSGIDAVSDILAAEASSTGAALDRIIIEVAKRLTIVRIASTREMNDRICTLAPSHIMRGKKRGAGCRVSVIRRLGFQSGEMPPPEAPFARGPLSFPFPP